MKEAKLKKFIIFMVGCVIILIGALLHPVCLETIGVALICFGASFLGVSIVRHIDST